MTPEVSASDMLAALQKDGFLALCINFDTGKSTIRPESRPIVGQVAALSKQNAGLNLSIEGHTDNAGTPAANKLLWEQRAKAVLSAVVETGVAAARLAAAGWVRSGPWPTTGPRRAGPRAPPAPRPQSTYVAVCSGCAWKKAHASRDALTL